jgi:hypothetical protein
MVGCVIPVSIGELYDKYTILKIKGEKLVDSEKLFFVNKEISFLKTHIDKYDLDVNIIEELKIINTILWDIEENIREKEKKQEFDEEFIELARKVYITNDKRYLLKAKINSLFNSNIKEFKSYA